MTFNREREMSVHKRMRLFWPMAQGSRSQSWPYTMLVFLSFDSAGPWARVSLAGIFLDFNLNLSHDCAYISGKQRDQVGVGSIPIRLYSL